MQEQVGPKPLWRTTMTASNNDGTLAGSPTRRRAMAGMAVALGSLAAVPVLLGKPQQTMSEAPSTGAEALPTYLHQEIEIKATAQRVYDALLDSKQFAAFTGLPAEISREAGGAFSFIWRLDRWPQCGTDSEQAHRPGVAARALESWTVFHCQNRTQRTSGADSHHSRSQRLSRRRLPPPQLRMDRALLGAAEEVSGLS